MREAVIIGGGLAGCLAARFLAEKNYKVRLYEKTDSIGGQIQDKQDKNTPKRFIQTYGIHILYGDDDKVFDILKRFTELKPCKMDAVSYVYGKQVPLPINFASFDEYFGEYLSNKIKDLLLENFKYGEQLTFSEIKEFLEKEGNMKETQMIEDLVTQAYKKYSEKQWKDKAYKVATIDRIKIIIGYQKNYLKAKYYYVPKNGYSDMLREMLAHKNIISIKLGYDIADINDIPKTKETKLVVNTTRLDKLFNFELGELEFKSLRTINYRICSNEENKFKTNAIHYPVNYDFIRESSMNNIQGIKYGDDIIVREYPLTVNESKGLPEFYIIDDERNRELQREYEQKCLDLKEANGIIWLNFGRLAEYKYYSMYDTIKKAIEVFEVENSDI